MKSKKFLIKSTNDVLHIGNLIAWIIQENKIKKKETGILINTKYKERIELENHSESKKL